MTYPWRCSYRIAVLSLLLGGCADRADGGLSQGGTDTGEEGETGALDESGSGEGSEDEDTGSDEAESGDGGLPDEYCDDACAATEPSGCFSPEACVAYCEAESPAWTPEIGDAFAECASQNPLCFESVEGCMLAELHPPGTRFAIRVEGAGFGAQAGQTVTAWHDPDATPSFGGERVITDGEFAFDWDEPIIVFDANGPLLLLYVDVDASGTCNPEIDLTASFYPEWNGDLLEPVFEAVLAPPLGPANFVCNLLP